MKQGPPKVSVIMPSYNHSDYIRDAIKSVLKQTIEHIELIIVDDGSNDKSPEIIKDAASTDERIKYKINGKNRGISKTINDCFRLAESRYIGFIASDDLWKENKIEKQLNVLTRAKCTVVWTEGKLIDQHGSSLDEYFTTSHSAANRKKSGNLFHQLVYGNYIFGSSVVFDRELSGEIWYDEELTYLNDYRFMLDLADSGNFCFIDEPLAYYRRHDENTSKTWDKKQLKTDRIDIWEYLVNEKIDKLTDDQMWYLYTHLAKQCAETLQNRSKGKHYLDHAIRIDPIKIKNVLLFVYIYTSSHPLIRERLDSWNEVRRTIQDKF